MYFEAVTADSYGRPRRTIYMNRDGFTLLVMGFTGKKALQFKLQYINQFNRMEEQLKSQMVVPVASYMIHDPIKPAEQWIVEQKQTMLLAETVQEQTKVIEQKEQVIAQKQDEVDELNELIQALTDGVPVTTQRQELVKLIQRTKQKNDENIIKIMLFISAWNTFRGHLKDSRDNIEQAYINHKVTIYDFLSTHHN